MPFIEKAPPSSSSPTPTAVGARDTLVERIATLLGLDEEESFAHLVPSWFEFSSLKDKTNLPSRLEQFPMLTAEFYQILQELQSFSRSQKRVIATVFLARYLPRLAKSILLHPSIDTRSPWYRVFVETCADSPLLALFTRTHPQGDELHRHLIEMLVASCPDVENGSVHEINLDLIERWGALCELCLDGFYCRKTADVVDPLVPPSWSPINHDFLQRLGRIVEMHAKDHERPSGGPCHPEVGHCGVMIVYLLGIIDPRGSWREFAYEQGRYVGYDLSAPWSRCEARGVMRLEHPEERAQTECQVLLHGQEMMYCAKCKSVRYCSRKHQRADWKRHKHLCIETSWE